MALGRIDLIYIGVVLLRTHNVANEGSYGGAGVGEGIRFILSDLSVIYGAHSLCNV